MQTGASSIATFIFPLAILAIFYFILIVPQRRQLKQHQELVAGLEKGDRVVTAGGIIGEITAIKDDSVQIKSGTSTVVVERSRIVKRNGAGSDLPRENLTAMALLKIELLGSEILRHRADELPGSGPDPELDRLIADMFETMYENKGIGLAGPQVGVAQRVIVLDVNDEAGEKLGPFALLNPRIVESGTELDKHEEGCLSIPNVTGVVERPWHVVVEGLDPRGEPVTLEADGMLARCLQHEIDHLDGVLFIDRLSPLKRNMLLRKYRKQAT